MSYEPYNWEALTPQPVIGVDEAGRGCLAGPVYAGAVILNGKNGLEKVTDSKLVSESQREDLFELIIRHHQVGIGFATVEEIAEINILNAALLAMKRAVESLGRAGHVLVDGNQKIKGLVGPQTTLIKGDLRALPVAAASIVAKVSRDRVMRQLAAEFPEYGFEKHKGYSTPAHKELIKKLGPLPIHRRTFAGVKEHWPSSGHFLV